MAQMVRALLEERFQLRTRVEKQDAPGYDLVVGKNGARLQLSPDQTPTERQPDSAPGAQSSAAGIGGGRTIPDGPLPRGSIRLKDNELTASAVTLTALAAFLSRQLDGLVTDRTNITSLVDLKLRFQPDLQPARIPLESILRGGGTNVAPPTRSAASIAAALQQLGLQLAAVKRSIDVFIIDSVQYPSEN